MLCCSVSPGRRTPVWVCLVSLMFALAPAGSSAAILTDDSLDFSKVLTGSGWRVHFGSGLNITLDGVTRDRAEVRIEKIAQFTGAFETGDVTLRILFEQIDVNAVPRIVIEGESVFNQTGSDWQGFRFSLIDLTHGASNHPTFDETRTFLDNDPLRIEPFSTYAINSAATEVVLSGGMLADQGVWLPGSGNGAGELVIDAALNCSGPLRSFYFNEQAIAAIPEPACAGLLTMSGAALFSRLRRRT